MSPEAVSPLRQRMIEDMTIRQFGEHTKRDYIRQVRDFTAFLGRSPDRADHEDLRRYQLHLASLGASYSRMNLSRYTHRVAIGNSRLVALDERGVTFRWKDYRARGKGAEWIKTMTLATDEFIRRFLLHVLPDGFHRIRHYGLFASGTRVANIARIRRLLAPVQSPTDPAPAATASSEAACPCCGGRLVIVERFRRGEAPRSRPTAIRIDTS